MGAFRSGRFLVCLFRFFCVCGCTHKLCSSRCTINFTLRVAANLQLRFHFRLVVRHIPGVLNGLADQASRSKVQHPVFKRYKQLPIPQPLRSRIGTMLLSGLPLPANLEASSTGQQKELSMSTAGQTATRPQPILHWILWSSLRWDPPNMDVFSILQTGCGTFAS